MKTSERLTLGQIYTRRRLIDMFAITDATINTGIFQPPGHDSIWLFVTENKTSDRTPYEDDLDGNILEWDSQRKGRHDEKIIHHRENGLEILVFYRKKKYEFEYAGFRYEGVFDYQSHSGTCPAHFKFKRKK